MAMRDTLESEPRHAQPVAAGVAPANPRVAAVVLLAAAVLLAWRLSDVVILAFGAALLALLLRALAHQISRGTRVPEGWAVWVVVLALLAVVGGAAWLFGSQIVTQFGLLAEDLPQSLSQVLREFGDTPWGAWLVGQAHGMNVTGLTGQLAGYLATAFGSLFRAIAYAAVLVFAALYLAAQPSRYREGVLRLVPQPYRPRAAEVLALTATTLRRWLLGQSITMGVIGTLTGLGLALLGVPAPLALGLIAGVFAFIPYVGPILAAAPGVLMAATQGPMAVVYVVAVYGGIHFVEGNLITPLVQAEAVELPPVLTLFATLVFGLMLGPAGVLLAAPLTVVLLVAINALYLEGVLGEKPVWPSDREQKPES